MNDAYKMPPRQSADGAVSVQRVSGGGVRIVHEGPNGTFALFLGEFNAWRVLGMLSLMLGLPLTKAAAKAIKL